MKKPSSVDDYIRANQKHRDALTKLRASILNHPFEETIKWGMPTYVYRNRNLIGIGAFKNHVGVWFFQGALLKDEQKILTNAQEGKTKAMRQVHYKEADEINEAILNAYLEETIANEDKGKFVKIERKPIKVELPDELQSALNGDPELKERFFALSPGRQKDYAEHIRSAKTTETKASRLEKILPLIRQGRGLNDKYKR